MCRTSMQRIRTSANVEGHLPLHYFNYCPFIGFIRGFIPALGSGWVLVWFYYTGRVLEKH